MMNLKLCSLVLLNAAILANAAPAGSFEDFQKRAAKFNAIVNLPTFELTTNEIRTTLTNTIAAGDASLDKVGRLKPNQVNFKNTVLALDDIGYQIALTANRLSVIKETSTNASLRDAATDA